MANFVPLRPSTHGKKTWKRPQTYKFAAGQPVVPIIGLELAQAVINMPVGFIKNGENYHLAALLSFQKDSNLFIGPDGRWIGSYIPAMLRSNPFRLMRQEGGEQMVLCVDEESGLVRESDGDEAFFSEDGKPTSPVTEIANFLQQLEASRLATDVAVKALAAADLIVPWEIKVKADGRELPVSGFFRTDESRLNGLDDQAFLSLRKAGALALAYGQVISMHRLEILGRLVEYHDRLDKSQRKPQDKPLPEFNELFGNDEKLVF